MPLLQLSVSVPVPKDKKGELLSKASQIVARITAKPESYVMVTLAPIEAAMGGKTVPAVFADVRGIGGLTGAVNADLSMELTDLFRSELNVAPENVYLNFTDVPAQNWGWKGNTFG